MVDESILSLKSLKAPVLFSYEYEKGKFKDKSLYAGGIREDDDISLSIDSSNLKSYIKNTVNPNRPSSFEFFSQQIRLAKSSGMNQKGLRHFGAALHVLEDYYAHTNYIEISLIKNGFTQVFPWVELDEKVSKIKNGAEKARHIPIVTGLFGPQDMVASVSPKIADALFPKEFQDYIPLVAGKKTYFDEVFLTVLTDLSQKEALNETKTKIVGFTFKEIKDAYIDWMSVRDGLVGAGEYVPFKEYIGEGVNYVVQAIFHFPNLLFNSILSSSADVIKESQSTKIGFGTDPTHTQISKDSRSHFFNSIAGYFATRAVRIIGKEMKKCWTKNTNVEEVIEKANKLFFIHPSDNKNEEVESLLKKWAKNNTTAIKRSNSQKLTQHYHKLSKDNLILTHKEIKKMYEYFRKF